uniref:Gustatory receptor n=1 Tax=Phlebotomus papatasi TaxID=29031 RepID=A0A3F2ZEI5_PHLPP
MDVLRALGYQFRIQKFITIPNYQLPGESLVHLVARMIPFAISMGIALTDVADMLLQKGVFLTNITNVPFIVNIFDKVVMKGGVIFVAVIAFKINQKHLNVLKNINDYDEGIRKYQERFIKDPVRFPTAKRSNIEFFMVFIVNVILCLNLHLMTALNSPPIYAVYNIAYIIVMSVHDYTIFYIANLMRLFSCHEVQLVQILENDLSRHNNEIFVLVNDFGNTINKINRAFGSLTFFTFVQHLIGGCMTTYLLFWLVFVSPYFPVKVIFCLSAAAYAIRMVWYLVHISVVGESIPKKIENLRCLIRRWMQDEDLCFPKENWVVGCRSEDGQNFLRAVRFNTHQLLLKNLHQGTQVSASEYFTINNSAIYATFGAVVTYLMVFIQFQELEEAKMAQEIHHFH